jgi:hypothetical protein
MPLGQEGDEHGSPIPGRHSFGGATFTSSGDLKILSERVVVGVAATKRFCDKASVHAIATITRRNSSAFLRWDLMGVIGSFAC